MALAGLIVPATAASARTVAEAERIVLALNSGSSSLKFGLYRVGASGAEALLAGEAAAIGEGAGTFRVHHSTRPIAPAETLALPSQEAAITRIAELLASAGLPAPEAIGHRIVHGGPTLRQHCLIGAAIVDQLEAATVFAPLHLPAALSLIRFAQAHFRALPQAACFDTAFHASLPDIARVLPIPRALQAAGIQRYGFHGLSCESIVHQLTGDVPDRIVIAHLGNGASVTAVKGGRSVDTSMGLTPTGGLIMGTRSGDLDPGVLVWLMREKNFDADMIEELIDRRSGLAGISGIGSDMRRLHEAAPSNADARLAIDMFCHAVGKQVAAMIAVLDGVDLLVFTGGIGENDAQVRAAICRRLGWIGVGLDGARNRVARNPVNDAVSRCAVLVLASREDQQIARHTWNLTMPAG